MAIDLIKSGIAVGVGAIDEVLERNDIKEGRVENFKKWSDIGRLAGAIAGYGAQLFMPRWSRLGEALALSSTTLLTKTLAQVVAPRGATSSIGGGVSRVFVPRARVPAGMPVGQTTKPEFEGERSY